MRVTVNDIQAALAALRDEIRALEYQLEVYEKQIESRSVTVEIEGVEATGFLLCEMCGCPMERSHRLDQNVCRSCWEQEVAG